MIDYLPYSKPGTIKATILQYINTSGPKTDTQVVTYLKSLKMRLDKAKVGESQLDFLVANDLLLKDKDLYFLTAKGLHQCKVIEKKTKLSAKISEEKKLLAPSRMFALSRESYIPVGLGQTCLRKGAYDAYGLPSLVNGNLVERSK